MKFYIDDSGFDIFYNFFSPFCSQGNAQCKKKCKNPVFGQFEIRKNLQHLLKYPRKKNYLNNFQNTISLVKFSAKFESFVGIRLRVIALPINSGKEKETTKRRVFLTWFLFYLQQFLGKDKNMTLILIKDLSSSGNLTWNF